MTLDEQTQLPLAIKETLFRQVLPNAADFDLSEKYVDLCAERLKSNNFFNQAYQLAVQDDALFIPDYFEPGSVSLIRTSPPYAP